MVRHLLSPAGAPIHIRQSSTLDGPNIPFLPPEIYLAIARHVQRTDLSNYRLASKTLADAGESELFRIMLLRNTRASWSALKCVKENKQLSRLVRTLVWDVNAWRIGTDVRDWHEWTRHCESQAERYAQGNTDPDPDQAALYKELAGSRHHWEAYLSRLEEEKAVSREFADNFMNRDSSSAWLQLPNLQTVHVVKGAYQLRDGHVCRLHEQAALPAASPLNAWRDDSLSHSVNRALLSAISGVCGAASSVTKWRFDGFTVQEHNPVNFPSGAYGRHSDVTSVKIRFGISNRRSLLGVPLQFHYPSCYGYQFLHGWLDLQSLTLDLYNHDPIGNDSLNSTRAIQNTFGVEGQSAAITGVLKSPLTWPRLRKLSLGHFSSTPKALLSLVTRHSSTLRDLRLHAIWMGRSVGTNDESSTQYSWQEVFRIIGAETNLEKLRLSGLFRNHGHKDDDWDFDIGGLCEHVAAWIIRGEQRSQREELLSVRRSYDGSHDRLQVGN